MGIKLFSGSKKDAAFEMYNPTFGTRRSATRYVSWQIIAVLSVTEKNAFQVNMKKECFHEMNSRTVTFISLFLKIQCELILNFVGQN